MAGSIKFTKSPQGDTFSLSNVFQEVMKHEDSASLKDNNNVLFTTATTQSGSTSSVRKGAVSSMFKLPVAYNLPTHVSCSNNDSVPSVSSATNHAHTHKIKEMEQKCAEADQTIVMLQNSVSEKERLLHTAQANCESRLKENRCLAQKLSQAMRSVQELELCLKNAQSAQIQTNVEEMEHELIKKEDDIRELKMHLSKSKECIQQLESSQFNQRMDAQTHVAELKAKIDKKEDHIQDLKRRLSESNEAVNTLEKDLRAAIQARQNTECMYNDMKDVKPANNDNATQRDQILMELDSLSQESIALYTNRDVSAEEKKTRIAVVQERIKQLKQELALHPKVDAVPVPSPAPVPSPPLKSSTSVIQEPPRRPILHADPVHMSKVHKLHVSSVRNGGGLKWFVNGAVPLIHLPSLKSTCAQKEDLYRYPIYESKHPYNLVDLVTEEEHERISEEGTPNPNPDPTDQTHTTLADAFRNDILSILKQPNTSPIVSTFLESIA